MQEGLLTNPSSPERPSSPADAFRFPKPLPPTRMPLPEPPHSRSAAPAVVPFKSLGAAEACSSRAATTAGAAPGPNARLGCPHTQPLHHPQQQHQYHHHQHDFTHQWIGARSRHGHRRRLPCPRALLGDDEGPAFSFDGSDAATSSSSSSSGAASSSAGALAALAARLDSITDTNSLQVLCLTTPCLLILCACSCIRLILPASRTASLAPTPCRWTVHSQNHAHSRSGTGNGSSKRLRSSWCLEARRVDGLVTHSTWRWFKHVGSGSTGSRVAESLMGLSLGSTPGGPHPHLH